MVGLFSHDNYLVFILIIFIILPQKLVVNRYISEKYLFVVAHNVGFLKRFAGL
jgi:hypothetical protein